MDEPKKPRKIQILVTDSQFHAVEPRKPTNWYRAIMKAINGGKRNRIFTKKIHQNDDGTFEAEFSLPPEMQKIMEEAKKNGEEIEFILPPGGIPVFLGKDAVEKMEAEERKKGKT